MHSRGTFPFSAIVGQDELKLALCVNAVDPLLGGALFRGERGSGKTTIVRALSGILPMQRVVAGCPYRCDPDDRGSMCAAWSCAKGFQRCARRALAWGFRDC